MYYFILFHYRTLAVKATLGYKKEKFSSLLWSLETQDGDSGSSGVLWVPSP